jgi:MFS family permease
MSKELWRINYDSPKSYYNWVDPSMLDLTCVSSNIIGSLGSSFFIGFAISCSFVPRLADKFGRKKPFIISLFV